MTTRIDADSQCQCSISVNLENSFQKTLPLSDQDNSYRGLAMRRTIRSVVATLGLMACLGGIWVASRVGLARIYVSRSKSADAPLAFADRAVRLNPSDPEAHARRAIAFNESGQLAEYVAEYRRAVELRPGDYLLWLELGHARDKMHDAQGALAAFQEAVRLAPYYAQPRWYLGYGWLRAERNDEGFSELRRAVEIDPSLLTKLFDLADEMYLGDPNKIQRRVAPQTDRVRLALARYFARHGSVAEAMELFRASQVIPDSERHDLVKILIHSEEFAAAYQVWAGGRGADQNGGIATLLNGGFESQLSLEETGFGWQIPREQKAARISVDDHEKYAGGRSLHVEFAGASEPSGKIISHLLLVEPGVRYRLTFVARTKELVTAGLSFISVTDAGDKDLPSLARSPSLPQGTSAWQDYAVEFVSPDREAVSINLLHENCATAPCSAFGHVWLDNFFLHKL